jgi:RNA polymerase sigma-70 factor (ECF subfamily)
MPLTKSELEETYQALETPLYNFALRWIFNPAQAEDIVHDAFVRIWNRRDETDLVTLKSLLYKTVQNLALNEIRRRRVRGILPIIDWIFPANDAGHEVALLEAEKLRKMQIGLESLPFNLREVLLLTEFSDLSHKEIALALAIAEGTVASRKSRAMQLLKDYFKEGKEYEF